MAVFYMGSEAVPSALMARYLSRSIFTEQIETFLVKQDSDSEDSEYGEFNPNRLGT